MDPKSAQVLATFLAFLAGVGASVAGVAGFCSLLRLRVPSGLDQASVMLSAADARANVVQIAAAASGAFLCGGALICAAIFSLAMSEQFNGPPVWFYLGVLIAVLGPMVCVFAAVRARALTRTAAIVMRYELGFPAGLRDHDAALESALAGETAHEAALQRYAGVRERALRRARPHP